MTSRVGSRRAALIVTLLLPLSLPLLRGLAGDLDALGAIKTIDPLAEGDLISAEEAFLKKDPELKKLLDTEVYQRLKQQFPMVALKAHVGKGQKDPGSAAGKSFYIAEGDRALDEAQLLMFAGDWEEQEDAALKALKRKLPKKDRPQPTLNLVLHRVLGVGHFWTPGSTVKYCVQRKTFDSDAEHADMVKRIKDAADAWQTSCNIKFEHVSSLDGTQAGANPPQGVTFTVRRAANDLDGNLAMAFFPGDGPDRRHVWIFPLFYGSHGFDKTGILRHELGHALGFRHEFARPQTPPNACAKEQLAGGLELGPFDWKSVMQYFCPKAGLGSKTMELTNLDIEGAQKVYGSPKK